MLVKHVRSQKISLKRTVSKVNVFDANSCGQRLQKEKQKSAFLIANASL